MRYDEDAFAAIDSDVSFSVLGSVAYSKQQQDASSSQQFKFPFTRSVDALSIMEQCQSIMRTNIQTHATVEYDDPGDVESNTAPPSPDSTLPGRRQTLEFLLEYVQRGDEWKPFDTSVRNNSDATLQASRNSLIRRIMRYADNNPLHGLYDERYVSKASAFCETDKHSAPARRSQLSTSSVWQNIGIDAESRSAVNFEDVLFLDPSQRTVGNMNQQCPCSIAPKVGGKCSVHRIFCELKSTAAAQDHDIFSECTRDSTHILYSAALHHRVRELLHVHSTFLSSAGF